MDINITNYLNQNFGIRQEVTEYVNRCEEELSDQFRHLDEIRRLNQYKVIRAMQEERIADRHFSWTTGYGYDDIGREAAERVYARVFGAEATLVRPTIVNGTHALAVALMGILRPGDEMIYCTGGPYDTLEEVIGIRGENKGSLSDYGVIYKEVPLKEDGSIDLAGIASVITDKTRMVCVQRSTGYSWRKAITIPQMKEWTSFVHGIRPDIICMADNCYGEFTDVQEPTEVGVDIMAGSLIKNPGGGLALSGGYLAGRKDLIELASYRMTCPGIGAECGLTFGQTRSVLQGLFLAPSVVNGALKGAMLCGRVYGSLGYPVCPSGKDDRSDIIQSVELGTPEAVWAFCEGIQAAAPVDSFVRPEPWDMPGYEDPVVMAAGAFVQGSSIELSADGPMREPYIVYFQGGLTYEHSRLGVMMSLERMVKAGITQVYNDV